MEEQPAERVGRRREVSAGTRGPGGSLGGNEPLERSLHSRERQAYISLRDKSRSHSGPPRGEALQEAQAPHQPHFDSKGLSPEYAQPRKAPYEEPYHARNDPR